VNVGGSVLFRIASFRRVISGDYHFASAFSVDFSVNVSTTSVRVISQPHIKSQREARAAQVTKADSFGKAGQEDRRVYLRSPEVQLPRKLTKLYTAIMATTTHL